MNYIKRTIREHISQKLLHSDKAVIVYGPRQVGKTTLCQRILKELPFSTLSVDGDQLKYREVLSSQDTAKLTELLHGYDLLFVDEAQKIPNIGINLKIIIDQIPGVKILATGSSSFDLASQLSEPMTGRKWTYNLYPISQLELREMYNSFELKTQIEQRLVWGSYPELFSFQGRQEKIEYLTELTSSYLYKDIIELGTVRFVNKIHEILKLLAYQIGSEVSLQELGTQVSMNKKTVARYIELLEKAFVIFPLSGFSRNLRKEVTKMNKYYFYDLGIRNSIIDNLKPLNQRDDVGALWENFLMVERLKRNAYTSHHCQSYFWRTYTKAELDYVEEAEGKLHGYEFKWQAKPLRAPSSWKSSYPTASFQAVNTENYLDFVL